MAIRQIIVICHQIINSKQSKLVWKRKLIPMLLNMVFRCRVTGYDNLTLTKLFLDAKANPNVKCSDDAVGVWESKNPLIFAKLRKNEEMIKCLLDSKATV
jgi:hypothetical protein